MSRRSGREVEKRAERKNPKDNQFRGFVNHTLTKEDKVEYGRWRADEDTRDNTLPSLLEDGYRLSLSMDKRTSSFMAAISTKDNSHVNAGLVLTARAGHDAWEAAARAMYLHYYVLEEIWPDPDVQGEYVDEWAID